MQNTWNAEPGKGIGNIFFGISKNRLVELLDEPDALDTSNEEGDVCEHYYYDDLDVAFTFSTAEEDRLLVITIGNPQCLVANVLHTGMDMKNALAVIDKLKWETPDIEKIEDDDLIYSYGDTGIDVWFEDGVLTGFQLSPQWKDDDTITWPKAT
ncbi:MAG: hypothetical protein U9O95_04280 [Candidatus Marinimicrobia bacterium]|nr:hypothetical protein [Candidatus Neomarinimicrobiota bacterium]